MKLPKLRKTVKIQFMSLRSSIDDGGGVIPDIDTVVERHAYRKKTSDGWKWQIKGLNRFPAYDIYAETDQESLDNLDESEQITDVKILAEA